MKSTYVNSFPQIYLVNKGKELFAITKDTREKITQLRGENASMKIFSCNNNFEIRMRT